MNVLAQRLNRLRCTYSTLLRLSKQRDHPHRLAAFSGSCKVSIAVPTKEIIDLEDRLDSEVLKENDYARNIFLNSYRYRKCIAPQNTSYAHVSNEKATELLNEDWSQKSNVELLSAVKKLNYNIYYSQERIEPDLYASAFHTLHDRLEQFKDDDLMILIRHLVPFREHLVWRGFYQRFCKQLNLECVKRFMRLPIDNTFALCDMLYEMTHFRQSEYIWYAIRKFGNKPNKLQPHHLVQVLFFLNVCRKPPVNMYELEYRLEQCFDELSIHELGIAALGFFKTGTRIRSTELLRSIMTKTTANMDLMDNVSIGAIVKLIRYSMQLTEVNTLKNLIDALVPIEPRLTLMTLNHVAHASTRVSLYHEELMNRIIRRLNNELKTARIKELERLMFFLASFNVDSSNSVYHNVIQELRDSWYTRRAKEIEEHPLVVSRLLAFLSYVNIYPTDLIERVMAPDFLCKSSRKRFHLVTQEFFVLDCGLQVEVPEYNGPLLQSTSRKYLLKEHFQNLKSAESSRANRLLMHVLQTCQEIFNNTSDVILDRPLPHFTTQDIVLGLDKQNQLVPKKYYPTIREIGDIKWMGKEDQRNIRWIALVMAYHGVLIKGTEQPTGLLATKIRQLIKIGYTPMMISHLEWEKRETQEERHNYIKQLLFQNNAPESIT